MTIRLGLEIERNTNDQNQTLKSGLIIGIGQVKQWYGQEMSIPQNQVE
jgi:hypothetical protein